ncbi:MAG: hypothetical protein EAZ34_05110 [Polaromonas sp.]|nr:MAG: hypothetical protein EAZ34_05110 [Polaromonas sp.]
MELAEFEGFNETDKQVNKQAKKNRRGSGGFLRFVAFFEVTQKSLYRRKRLRTRSNQNKTKLNAWQAM